MSPEDENGRSHTPKGKARKGKILDMAEKVFAQKGFAAASISDVVSKLGISAGALYHHFPSKKELLAGIAKRSMRQMCELMDNWIEDERLSPGEKMDRFLGAVEERRQLKKKLLRVDLGLAGEDGEVHEMVIHAGLEPVSERLTRMIELGNASGEFQVEYPRATATFMFLILADFMHRSKRLEEVAPVKELDRTMEDAMNQFLRRKDS
ncbi:MAG: TetR/AcrR family transcriptional regulator [Verrucomicrobiota bacterium]